MKNKNITTEYEESRTFAEYLSAKKLLFSHLAQSTFTKSFAQLRKNKAMGVHKGVPDYMIIIPGNGLLFIEMKRKNGGVVSPEQKEWISELNSIKNVGAFVAYGCDEAIDKVESLLK